MISGLYALLVELRDAYNTTSGELAKNMSNYINTIVCIFDNFMKNKSSI